MIMGLGRRRRGMRGRMLVSLTSMIWWGGWIVLICFFVCGGRYMDAVGAGVCDS